MKKNQGSVIIEVTLIMPILLMMMVLFITMLLSVFQQARVHSDLMYYSAGSENLDRDTFNIDLSIKGDKKTLVQDVSTGLIQGYNLSGKIQQTVRVSKVEENLRRWQVIGGLAAE